jgi:hypothetical protein
MKQPMSEARRKALARAFPLRDARKEWNAIAQILEREGFRDDKGKPYSSGALKEAHSRLKGILPTEPGTLTHEAVNKMLETLETKLTTLIDDKLAKVGR